MLLGVSNVALRAFTGTRRLRCCGISKSAMYGDETVLHPHQRAALEASLAQTAAYNLLESHDRRLPPSELMSSNLFGDVPGNSLTNRAKRKLKRACFVRSGPDLHRCFM